MLTIRANKPLEWPADTNVPLSHLNQATGHLAQLATLVGPWSRRGGHRRTLHPGNDMARLHRRPRPPHCLGSELAYLPQLLTMPSSPAGCTSSSAETSTRQQGAVFSSQSVSAAAGDDRSTRISARFSRAPECSNVGRPLASWIKSCTCRLTYNRDGVLPPGCSVVSVVWS